jgi:hypothetical protein
LRAGMLPPGAGSPARRSFSNRALLPAAPWRQETTLRDARERLQIGVARCFGVPHRRRSARVNRPRRRRSSSCRA